MNYVTPLALGLGLLLQPIVSSAGDTGLPRTPGLTASTAIALPAEMPATYAPGKLTSYRPADISGTSKRAKKLRKYVSITEIGYSPGIGDVKVGERAMTENSDRGFVFQSIHGFRIKKAAMMGVGAGIDLYKNVSVLPVFADVRVFLSKDWVAPMLIADAGYAVGLKHTQGGFFVHPAAGLKFHLDRGVDMHVSVGYKMQQLSAVKLEGMTDAQATDQSMNFLTFKIGLSL